MRALLLLGVVMLNIVFASSELPAYISKEGKRTFLLREGCQEDACLLARALRTAAVATMAAKPGAVFTVSPKAWGGWGGACGRRDDLGLLHGGCWASLFPGSIVSRTPYLHPSVEMTSLWFWVGDFP